jgi:hypothetical protein
MVRILLVIQVPDTSHKGSVTLRFRPIDCFFLSFEGAEHVVRVIFDYIVVDRRPFWASLWPGFYVNVCQGLSSLRFLSKNRNYMMITCRLRTQAYHNCFIVGWRHTLSHRRHECL